MSERAADWETQVTVDPSIRGGRPVIKGTRVPIHIILEALASGMNMAEVCEEYTVTEDQARAALGY